MRLVAVVAAMLGTSWAAPRHVHLSLAEHAGAVRVTWSTSEPAPGSAVEYSCPAGAAPARRAAATSTLFNSTETGYLAHIHRALIPASPGVPCSYRVGSDPEGWSVQHQLSSPAQHGPVRLIALADMSAAINDGGHGGVMREIGREVAQGGCDLVLHGGDLAYDLHDLAVGDEFCSDIEPVASLVPYMVAPGNHEAYYNFSHYPEATPLPGCQ